MAHASQSFFDKAYNPVYQALASLAGVISIILLSKMANAIGLVEIPDRFPWLTAASFILLFSLFNSVFSLATDNMVKYWGRSIYSFLGLAAGSGIVAYLFSHIPISEAGSYRWIYFVLFIGYLVFLSMMATIRRIVEFAQKEEWNHPRIRRKNNKKN